MYKILHISFVAAVLALPARAIDSDVLFTNVTEPLARLCSIATQGRADSNIDELLTAADHALASAIAGMLPESGSMEKLSARARDRACIEPLPRNRTYAAAMSNESQRLQIPTVSYRDVLLDDGSTLIFCENSFRCAAEGSAMKPSLYVIHFAEGKTDISFFQEYLWGGGVSSRSLSSAPVLLDIFPMSNRYPKVVMLYGPKGTGHFASLKLFSYDAARRAWLQQNILEVSGMLEYSYSASSRDLTYTAQSQQGSRNLVVNLSAVTRPEFIASDGLAPAIVGERDRDATGQTGTVGGK